MTEPSAPIVPGALSGLRVFDLTRVLAGPVATQIFGDWGADIWKIERPGEGDDTRKWGPPFLKDAEGRNTTESAYYLSANRNKRSLAIDIAHPEGQRIALELIGQCDILMENYKVGGLKKYGLAYEQIKDRFPRLIYCSVTGFGQSGPYAARPGYDYLAQGMGGIMSLTGDIDGPPTKVAVAIADTMCGMYAGMAVLAALRHRDLTGQGQWIDACLLDTQVAWLGNAAQQYLVSGEPPARLGNGHPTVVPYEVFSTQDGYVILAIGNDSQFKKFCQNVGRADLAQDERFATNAARVRNRADLLPIIREIMQTRTTAQWLLDLEPLGVPAGPVNRLDEVFADPQVKHREMVVQMAHPQTPEPISLLANPVKMSATPAQYRYAPPLCGQHTDEVLREALGYDAAELARLRKLGAIG